MTNVINSDKLTWFRRTHATVKRDFYREFEILMENSPLGVVLTTHDSEFLYVNPTFIEMLGYTEEEFQKLTVPQITHPDSIEASKDAIRRAFAGESPISLRKQYLHKDGSIIDANTRIAAVFDDKGRPLYQCTNIEDITAKLKVDKELTYHATHDTLTGLINRREFERRTGEILRRARQDNSVNTLLYLDLDQFKAVNDTGGHAAGDALLRQVCSILKTDLRKNDTLARLGGDEFGLLLPLCEPKDAIEIAESITSRLGQFTFIWNERRFKIGISIGLTTIDSSTKSLSILMRDADTACYAAKSKGGHRVHLLTSDDSATANIHQQLEWIVRINQGFQEERFQLYAQSIVPINGNRGVHYEVLLRMVDESGNLHLPDVFLPVAERYNLAPKIDRWVFAESLRILSAAPAFCENMDFCAINLSGLSLTDPEVLRYIKEQLTSLGIPGNKLCFEITETAAISDLNAANHFINELRSSGCQFSLDDFGSGLSSFGYLKNLSVDYIKIDGIFVQHVLNDAVDQAIVKSINNIAKKLGLQTIAEYAEDAETIAALQTIGVDYIQGFGVDKPIPLEAFIAGCSSGE